MKRSPLFSAMMGSPAAGSGRRTLSIWTKRGQIGRRTRYSFAKVHGPPNRRDAHLPRARRAALPALLRDRRFCGHRPAGGRQRDARSRGAGARAHRHCRRHPAGLRGPGPAALGPRFARGRHLPEQPGHYRQRLPRRGGRHPRQPRAEDGDAPARGPDRAAGDRPGRARRAGRERFPPADRPRRRRLRPHRPRVADMLTLADLLDRGGRHLIKDHRGHPLLGSLPEVRRDPIRLFLESFQQYGEVVRFHFGPMIAHLVSSPAGANHVLAENNKNYGKQTRGYRNLRYVLGNGLLTSEGEAWKRQRRIAQPAFHRQRIAGFGRTMVRAAEDAADSLSLRRGEILDLHQEMMRVTLRIVGETLLAYDPTNAADEVGAALAYLLPLANERSSRLLDVPPVVPTRENRKFRRQLATLDSVVLRMIAERRKDPGDRGDLLSMLIEARDAETGESMDDRQLRAELSQVLDGRSPTVEDLPRLTLTRWTLQESMRLYPPAWVIARSANGADEIGGHEIPARSIVFVSPYVVHRHPRFWSDPEGFDPGRFAKEPQRGAYLPFGAGPRMCIGNAFASMEAELVLATIAQRIGFELVPGAPVELQPSITLRPRHGVSMRVR